LKSVVPVTVTPLVVPAASVPKLQTRSRPEPIVQKVLFSLHVTPAGNVSTSVTLSAVVVVLWTE
jgi:hypothetical protein